MRKLTQPRRLRRSFGSQLVGNVAGSRCPEAGLEARVVLANRRVRLFKKDNGRLGDLATWRLGDLATWSWMTTEVPAREPCSGHGSGVSITFNINAEGFASSRVSGTRRAFPSPRNCPNDYSRVFARHRLSLVKPLSLIVARNQRSPRDGDGSWELFINTKLRPDSSDLGPLKKFINKYLSTSLDRQHLNDARLRNRWVRSDKFTA
jgi:hypothetical protein